MKTGLGLPVVLNSQPFFYVIEQSNSPEVV